MTLRRGTSLKPDERRESGVCKTSRSIPDLPQVFLGSSMRHAPINPP
jgi:hypothetical protein